MAALPLPDGATVRPELIKRPQPTGKPAAASILAEGSLNDSSPRNGSSSHLQGREDPHGRKPLSYPWNRRERTNF